MYKNLNAAALGVSGRQSEIIELTLTYGFRGMDVDMEDLLKRSRSKGVEQATRFISSANLRIGGFELPLSLAGNDATFEASLNKLDAVAEIADAISASRCLVTIEPASDELPYHENFERHRTRLAQVAERLGKHEIRLGIGMDADVAHRRDRQFQFLHKFEDLLTLVKTIGASNVGLLLDTWSWYVGGGGLDQLDDLRPEQIMAVRLADMSAEADLSEATSEDRILPSEDGMIDTHAVVAWLVKKEYKGPVTPWPSTAQFQGLTRESIVQQARDCLDEHWAAAGLSAPKMEVAATAATTAPETPEEPEE